MKKILALFLILATLAPMALSRPADAAVAKEPFYALSWTDFDETKYPNLNGLVTTSFSNIGEYAVLSLDGAKMQYGSYTDADVEKMAQALKARLEPRPAGSRYWHIFKPAQILKLAPEDVLFLEHGVEQLRAIFDDLYKKMAEIKCPLDGVIVDTEIYAMGSWYLWTNSGNHSFDWYNKNKQLYAQIVKNPKYKKLIRPLLEEYGFPFYPNPSGEKSEIFYISYTTEVKKAPEHSRATSIWGTVMRVHLNRYISQWAYEPLMKYYPDATCSDYQSLDSKSWYKLAGIDDGGIALSGGNSEKVGDVSTYSYYFNHPSQDFFTAHDKYASYNEAVFEQSPFNCFLYEVNFSRHMYSSTDSKQIAPWMASYLYSRDKAGRWNGTPYYSELWYHLGMFDPEPFLFYNTKAEVGGEEGWDLTGQTANAILKALSDVAGYADRKPIELPQYWNAEYTVSGMYAGGRNIWRVTPNTDEISLSAFKVKDSDPTFSVKGQTITFPGGKILKEATIPNVGSCGYWVETKAGVNPVMTSDADRYAKYPSYLETFDSYANGALTPDKMKEEYAWKLTGSASIANKALTLSGDARLQNVEIPAKITAGDSYAKHQTWEITFTVPSGLSADAEIVLLQYEGKGGATDGGIKIQGGKVYYSDLVSDKVEYQELTAINPGTYTIKRVLNFSNSDVFSYDVYLLDSKGKEITNSKGVAASSFTAITGINISTKKASKAVSLDNYKLYPSGLATDFELYDAGSGRNIRGDEFETARTKDTAYRLSWLNGTNATKTATVVAAIYENGSLKSEKAVKTLTMKPGHDGVETGVVEVKAGQSVHVYLKNGTHQDVTYTEPGATESGSKTEPTKENTNNSATKATSASSSKETASTKATKPVRATKTPTRASKATKATKPGQTLAPDATETTEATAPIVKTEVFEGGIQELLDVLIEAGLDSVDKVKAALAQNLLTANKNIPAENIVHYDVKADKDDIPADGKMTIVLPYPAGTDATYTFYVAHMFTTDAHGKTPGEIEMPEVTNTEDGIQFQVTGLSPITVGWTAPNPDATEAPTDATAPIDETEGKDNTLLIIGIAVAVLAVAGGVTFFLLKKKKPEAPTDAPAEEPEEVEDLNNDPEA